jgi:hypothetical protein
MTGRAAAGVTGDGLLLGKRHRWGPGKGVVGGLHLKHMGEESTDANKHYSAVHSQLAASEPEQQSSALSSGVDSRPPVLDTAGQSGGWVEGPALGAEQWA